MAFDPFSTLISSGSGFPFGSLISGASSLVGNLLNFFSQKETNKTNKQINEDNLDYNAAMTRESWERDDTAHQREVADLEAAGLSPLANTTGNQVTSPLSAPNPIAMQAPQIDATGIINNALRAKELDEEKRHNLFNEGAKEIELMQTAEQISNEAYSLDIQNKKVEGELKYYADLIQNEAESIAETKKHNKQEEDLRRVEYESNMYWQEVKEQNPYNTRHDDIYDFDIYVVRKKLWDLQFKNFLKEIGATQTASAKSVSDSGSTGISLGVSNPATGMTGINGGINGSGSYSESEYKMENLSEYQKKQCEQFFQEHPIPVYHIRRWNVDYANR